MTAGADLVDLARLKRYMAVQKTHGYFTGLSRNTFLLAFSSLFADISTEMIVPVLPIFLTQTLKVSATIGVCGLAASLIGGWLWDHVGHTAVLFFGAVFAVVGSVALVALIPGSVKRDRDD